MANRKSMSVVTPQCGSSSIILRSILLSFFFLALALPTASAMGIDNFKNSIDTNGKSFDVGGKALEYNPIWKTYKPIKITNMLGLGKTLFRGALTQHDEVCGIDCQSTIQVYLAEDSVLIDDVVFKTLQNDGSWVEQGIRSYQFYIDDVKYNLGDEVKKGNYEVKLEAEKKPSRTVDWVIETQGEILESWAVWGSIATIYDDFEDASINTSKWANTSYAADDGGGDVHSILVEIGGYMHLDTYAYSLGTATAWRRVNSTDMPDIADINELKMNITQTVSLNNVAGSAYTQIWTFGTKINQITQSGVGTTNDYSVWKLLRTINVSCGVNCFNVYNDDVFVIQINATSNNVSFYAYSASTGGVNTNANADIYIDYVNFQEGQITLNSPVDNYISPTNLVTFNALATIIGGATIENMSLWTNETGNWEIRNTTIDSYYMTIEATSYGGSSSYVRELDTGIWLIATTNSSESVGLQKAKIHQLLWSSGDILNFVSITKIGVSDSDDIGKRGYKFTFSGTITDGSDPSDYSTGTFGTTTGNIVNSWSSLSHTGTSNEIGTDTSGDDATNPSTCFMDIGSGFPGALWQIPTGTTVNSAGGGYGAYSGQIIVFGKGTLSFGAGLDTTTLVDYYTDESIPETTATEILEGIFERTITDTMSWNVQVCDSDGDCGFASENYTVFLDTDPPIINITYPITSIDYGYTGENMTLNWTVTDDNLASCWYNYNNTNTTVTCADKNVSFISEKGNQTIVFYANDSVTNINNTNRSWAYKIFNNLESYNSTTYETAPEGFRINITSDGTQTVLANLIYHGTSYVGTKVGGNTEMEFYKDFTNIAEILGATAENKSFYWNVTYGSEVISTNTINQSVGRIALGLCNSTLTTPYINFTFTDEETTIATNASIDSSTWYYYLGDGTVNKTLLYSTTTANESYGFCFIPTDRTMKNSVVVQYSDTGYPQRRWTSDTDLTNSTTNQTLYMLASADGTYSVYQVQTSTGTGISGVYVQAERQFAGEWTTVEEGSTGSGGAVTFWLNPDYDHRLTFTKSGYTTIQVTVRPSSSTYTVVMGAEGVADATYNSSTEGLSWKVYPDLGKVLFPNTTQMFLFNITANLSNIDSCKMEIVNNNSVSLGTTIGCNSQGGNLSLSVPLGTNRSVRAIYSVDIGDGYFILDADAYWIVMTTNIPERGTIVAFFKYARNLNEFGSDDNRQEYSRVVFFFLMLSIILGSICYSTGWDFSTAGGAMGLLTFLIIMGSYGGFLNLSYTRYPVNLWLDQYVVALITSLFAGGFILNKFAREA